MGNLSSSCRSVHTAIDSLKVLEILSKHLFGIFGTLSSHMNNPNLICNRKRAFRSPFSGPVIKRVKKPNAVAYLSLPIVLSKLKEYTSDLGVYVEFHVHANPDNFSLSLVDFDGFGSSSLTFSPDSGVVILETKKIIAVTGSFTHALPECPLFNTSKPTKIALFISSDSSVEFFRNAGNCWERTGCVSDSGSWVSGDHVTPCLAFRRPGAYNITLHQYSLRTHPRLCGDVYVGISAGELVWKSLVWENEDNDDETSTGLPS